MAPAKKPEPKKTTEPSPITTPATETQPTSSTAKTNSLAIIALILAFILPLIGLILGIVALGQIKKRNEGGKGLAVGSIVVAIVIMVLQILAVAIFWGSLFAFSNELKKQGVDINNGTVNVKTDEGDSASFGNAKLPDGFPSDVPIYPGSKITVSSKSDGNKYNVILTTTDSKSKVDDYYKKELAAKGWSSGSDTGSYSFESGSLSTFNKGSQQLLVTVTQDSKDKNDTVISLSVYPKD